LDFNGITNEMEVLFSTKKKESGGGRREKA